MTVFPPQHSATRVRIDFRVISFIVCDRSLLLLTILLFVEDFLMPPSVSLYAPVSFRTFSVKPEDVRTVSCRFFCRFVQSAFRHWIEFRRSKGRVQLHQCFSSVGPRPGTGTWYQLYRAARGSPGICHFSFLSIFMNKYFIVEIF